MNECCLTHLILLTHILFCYLNSTLHAVVALYAFRKWMYNGRRVKENIIKVFLLKKCDFTSLRHNNLSIILAN